MIKKLDMLDILSGLYHIYFDFDSLKAQTFRTFGLRFVW